MTMLAPFLLTLACVGQDPPPTEQIPKDESVIAVKVDAPDGVDTSDLSVTVSGPANSFQYDPHASEIRVSGSRRWNAWARCGLIPCPIEPGREFHRYRSREVAFGRDAKAIELDLEPRSIVHGQLLESAVPEVAWVTLTGPHPLAPTPQEPLVTQQVYEVSAAEKWRFAFGELPPGGYELGVLYVEGTRSLPLRSILLRGEAERRVDLRGTDVPPSHVTRVKCRYEGLEVSSGIEFYFANLDPTAPGFGFVPLTSPVSQLGYEDGCFLLPLVTEPSSTSNKICIQAQGRYWSHSAVYPNGDLEVTLSLDAVNPPANPLDQLRRACAVEGRVEIDPARLAGLDGELYIAIAPANPKSRVTWIGQQGHVERQPLTTERSYRFEGLRCGAHVLMVELHPSPSLGLPILLEEHLVEIAPGSVTTNCDFELGSIDVEGKLRVRLIDAHGKPVHRAACMMFLLHSSEASVTGQLPYLGRRGDELIFDWPDEVLAFHESDSSIRTLFWLFAGNTPKEVQLTPGQETFTITYP